MKSLYTSSIAFKSLGRVSGQAGIVSRESLGDQHDCCEVSRKSLGTGRIAVKSLGRALRPAGWL